MITAPQKSIPICRGICYTEIRRQENRGNGEIKMVHAIIIASSGSSAPEALAGIAALENALSAAAPGCICARAFTSPAIRRVLAERGENVPSPAAALEQLRRAGARRVAVQPTHLICGHEYGKLKADALAAAGSFEYLAVGLPLLAGGGDIREFAARLAQNHPAVSGETAVFMGHGAGHFAGMAYPALQTALRLEGREDIYIGVMNGWPSLGDIIRQLGTNGPRRVRLLPLLLAAGKHARRDLAGTWTERLEQAGHTVQCSLAGLGGLPWVQEMYREKLIGILPP